MFTPPPALPPLIIPQDTDPSDPVCKASLTSLQLVILVSFIEEEKTALVEVILVPLALEKLNKPEIYKLVDVTFTLLTLVVKKFVEVIVVPEALVKVNPEAESAPDKTRLPFELSLLAEEKNWISPVPLPP